MKENVTMSSRTFRWVVSLAALLGVAWLQVPAATAAISFESFSGRVVDELGGPFDQAGGHPYAAGTSVRFNLLPNQQPVEDMRDVTVSLPPGFVGVPTAVPRCPGSYQVNVIPNGGATDRPFCPVGTQVGVATIYTSLLTFSDLPVFNVEPPTGVPARLAFGAATVDIAIDATVRPGDFGIDATSRGSSQGLPVKGFDVTLWGVPADDSHDSLRTGEGITWNSGGGPASVPEQAFIANPMHCAAGLLTTHIRANSWQSPDQWATASFDHDDSQVPPFPMAVANCERVPFDPSMSLRPTTAEPDSPTGLAVTLAVPQGGLTQPGGIATAHLKKATVTLPEGMTINPGAADGLDACSDEQLRLRLEGPARCPEASKIGTVEVDTPLLDKTVGGSLYIRSQNSDDPQSGEMFRLGLEVRDDDRGIAIRLPGQVRANPQTGRLEATFDQNPQLPFDEMRLRFKGGPRAALATPPECGTHTIDIELTSWAGHVRELRDSFTIACPGADGFAPTFDAGSISPTGGAFSPFVARIARDDRQQFLSGVQVDLPRGLLARLAGVERCSGFAADNGGCPANSRIGTAVAAAGAGSSPYHVRGDVFLTEGYKGAPYGMAVHVQAKAGPFDLGWVRVRQALHVDRTTAEVSVVSDPLPQIVKGVPVRLRSVDMDVDRPDFTVNPTSCAEKRVEATLTSVGGAVHRTGRRFQGADCQALPFKPRLGLRLTGKRQRTTGRHPGVRAVVRQTGIGEAGIEKARVALPKSLALDPDNAQALCEHEDGIKPDLENHCPEGSIVGRARAKTPLLGEDLVGDVYFVKNVKRSKTGNLIRTLPMIVVALRGEIAINLKGVSSTTRNNRLVNTFAEVPDAPITRFNLNIKGGKTGILAVTRTRRAKIDLCTNPKSHTASTRWRGHNGKQAAYRVRVKTPCGKASKANKAKKGKRSKNGR